MPYLKVDPYKATREEFTNDILAFEIHEDADSAWKEKAQNSKDLLKKLAFHDAMAPNLQQTYMTPANSKNKIYFMWDFVGRTLGILYQVRSTKQGRTRADKEGWADVISRSHLAADLILDSQAGMLDMMMESSHPGQPGPIPQFDEESKELARKLKR